MGKEIREYVSLNTLFDQECILALALIRVGSRR